MDGSGDKPPVKDHAVGNDAHNHDLNNNNVVDQVDQDIVQEQVDNIDHEHILHQEHNAHQINQDNAIVQVDDNNHVIVDHIAANVEVVADDVVQIQNEVELAPDFQGDNVAEVQADPPLLFPGNILIPRLTNGQRITLAYNYSTIPARVVPEGGGVDPDEVVEDDQHTVHTSFPVAPVIRDAFSGFVNYFEKKSGRELSDGSGQSAAAVGGQGTSVPASNKFVIKSGFAMAPIMDQWAFKSHYRDIPQSVEFDGDITSVKNKADSPLPKSITLKENEWGNLQKSASYVLRATSHIEWFRGSAKNALDSVLQTLDPNTHGDQIKALKDAKQFLRGISYGSAQIAKMGVYQHGGVTSHLRSEFLTQEGNNILLEEKSQMFSFPYGTSLVFNGLLNRVAPSIKIRRDELTSNRLLGTSIRIADNMSKGNDRGFRDSQQYYPPKPYTPKQGRGGGQQGNRNRTSNSPYYKYNTRSNNNNTNKGKPFPGKRGQGSGDPNATQHPGSQYKQQYKGFQGAANSGQPKN